MTEKILYKDLTSPLSRQKTLVCVTDQRKCDRIIKAGKQLASMTNTQLCVINIAVPGRVQDPQSMEYLFSVSKENDAEMNIIFSDNVLKALVNYIKQNKISCMLTGIPMEGNSIVTKIWKKFTHITFFVVEADSSLREVTQPAKAAQKMVEARNF